MKNMMRLVLLILAIGQLFSNNLKAQTFYNNDPNNNFFNELKIVDNNKQLKGNHYLSDDWQVADVIISGESIEIKDVRIMIDITNSVVELQLKDRIVVLPSQNTEEIRIKGVIPMLFYSRASIDINGPKGFYKQIYNGGMKLYCHYSTRIEESQYNEALAVGERDDRIVQIKSYYLEIIDNLIQLESKKGKLIEQLNGGSELEKFAKKNGINIKKEKDLIALIEFADKNSSPK